MIFRGHAWIFGDDIDTDVIIPVRFCISTDPDVFGKHCMDGIDPDFPNRIARGDIIVAGKNFGCGSSREPAPISIKTAGISCVIAGTFARIFYRNAFNVGLPLLECADARDEIREGDEIEVDHRKGIINNVTMHESYRFKPLPPFMQALIDAGGLIPWTKRRLKEE